MIDSKLCSDCTETRKFIALKFQGTLNTASVAFNSNSHRHYVGITDGKIFKSKMAW
jgi:hypothetical protein